MRNDWVSEVVRLRRDRPEPLEFVLLSGAGSAFVCAGLDAEASGVVFGGREGNGSVFSWEAMTGI